MWFHLYYWTISNRVTEVSIAKVTHMEYSRWEIALDTNKYISLYCRSARWILVQILITIDLSSSWEDVKFICALHFIHWLHFRIEDWIKKISVDSVHSQFRRERPSGWWILTNVNFLFRLCSFYKWVTESVVVGSTAQEKHFKLNRKLHQNIQKKVNSRQ